MAPAALLDLPDDLLVAILGALGPGDAGPFRLACRRVDGAARGGVRALLEAWVRRCLGDRLPAAPLLPLLEAAGAASSVALASRAASRLGPGADIHNPLALWSATVGVTEGGLRIEPGPAAAVLVAEGGDDVDLPAVGRALQDALPRPSPQGVEALRALVPYVVVARDPEAFVAIFVPRPDLLVLGIGPMLGGNPVRAHIRVLDMSRPQAPREVAAARFAGTEGGARFAAAAAASEAVFVVGSVGSTSRAWVAALELGGARGAAWAEVDAADPEADPDLFAGRQWTVQALGRTALVFLRAEEHGGGIGAWFVAAAEGEGPSFRLRISEVRHCNREDATGRWTADVVLRDDLAVVVEVRMRSASSVEAYALAWSLGVPTRLVALLGTTGGLHANTAARSALARSGPWLGAALLPSGGLVRQRAPRWVAERGAWHTGVWSVPWPSTRSRPHRRAVVEPGVAVSEDGSRVFVVEGSETAPEFAVRVLDPGKGDKVDPPIPIARLRWDMLAFEGAVWPWDRSGWFRGECGILEFWSAFGGAPVHFLSGGRAWGRHALVAQAAASQAAVYVVG